MKHERNLSDSAGRVINRIAKAGPVALIVTKAGEVRTAKPTDKLTYKAARGGDLLLLGHYDERADLLDVEADLTWAEAQFRKENEHDSR